MRCSEVTHISTFEMMLSGWCSTGIESAESSPARLPFMVYELAKDARSGAELRSATEIESEAERD